MISLVAMEKLILLILVTVISLQSHGQLFIDDGPQGTLYIAGDTSGTLASPEASAENVALYVDSCITIEGTYVNDSAEVQFTGDLFNTGTFTTTGDEVFVGSDTQFVSGTFMNANDFFNFIIDKDSGTLVQLTDTIEIDTSGILNLNMGIVQTTSANYLYVKNTDSSSIVNADVNGALDKFIEGELRRAIKQGSTYAFPVGGTHIDSLGGAGIQYAYIKSNDGDGVISTSFQNGNGIGISDSIVVCSPSSGDHHDIEFRINNGTWEITNPGGGVDNYDITLDPTDFTDNGYMDYTIIQNGMATGKDPCDSHADGFPITHNGLTSFSIFEVGASTNTVLLPIELLSFDVSLINNEKVLLNWRTISETNNSHFTVERSKEGLYWSEIARVKGAGHSSALLSYSVLDENPLRGTSHYRLKQTDFDNQFAFSSIKSIHRKNERVSIYPNPVTTQITVEGTDLNGFEIYDLVGNVVTYLSHLLTNNEIRSVIDLSKLKSGIYFVKIGGTTHKVTKR